jgi:hypothetical protein
MISSKFGNSDVSAALLDTGAKIDESNVDIDKLLLEAIGLRNTKAVDKLLKAIAACLPQDDYEGNTDLIAKQVSGLDLLKILQGARSLCIPCQK